MHEFGEDDPPVGAYEVGDEVAPGVDRQADGRDRARRPRPPHPHPRRGPAGLRRRDHRLGRRAGLRARLPDGRARDGQEGHGRARRAAARAGLRPPAVRPRRPGDRPRPNGPGGVHGEPPERGLRRCSPSGPYANMCSLWTQPEGGDRGSRRSPSRRTRLGIPVLRPIVEHGRVRISAFEIGGPAPPRAVQVGVARSRGERDALRARRRESLHAARLRPVEPTPTDEIDLSPRTAATSTAASCSRSRSVAGRRPVCTSRSTPPLNGSERPLTWPPITSSLGL